MFGISFSEILLIAFIALIVVGPQKLPAMLLSVGRGIAKIRRLTNDVRAQTGIDEILREEGIDGVRELRSLLRGEVAAARARGQDPHDDAVELDESQEYPPEGADAGGALPDDLVDQGRASTASEPSAPPDVTEANAPPAEEGAASADVNATTAPSQATEVSEKAGHGSTSGAALAESKKDGGS